VSTRDDVEEFAALLRRLKAGTDRSYGALARRLNMNTSTLHRYCAGDAVPLDFAPVERFAALCGATPAERLELHRLWILAVAARQRARTSGPAETPAPDPSDDQSDGSGSSGTGGSDPSTTGEPDSGPRPKRPWYRRRITVTAAAAAALLATLGSLSAFPSDGPSADAAPGSGSSSTATSTPGTRDRPSMSSSPDAARPSTSPTPSAGDAAKASPSPTKSGESSGNGNGNGNGDGKADGGAGSTAVPVTWTANSQVWANGCSHEYVVGKPPEQVPPPPAPQDAGIWARTQNAVHGRETIVEISVQGRTSTAVVLEALRVRVVGRTAPAKGNVFSTDQGCGGSLTPRTFAVDLDVDRPIARSLPGNDAGTPIPAVRMPYQVSAQDPEVLRVTARTETCDCRWYLELDWSSQGRTGSVRIDDNGRPFRTSDIKGLPRYMYDTSERHWTPWIE
jgi:hypothetical protein